MSAKDREFGDIVANYAPNEEAAILPTSTDDEIERMLATLARAHGMHAGDMLDDFRRGGPLAMLVRQFFNAVPDERDGFWKAVDLVNGYRAAGMTRATASHMAAKDLSAPDAAGRVTRNVTAGTVEQYAKEAPGVLKANALASLYAPDGWRPARRPTRRRKGNTPVE